MREFKMNVATTEENNLIKIVISGSADPAGIKKMIEIIDSISSGEDKDVDFDLAEMEYMDSTCIGILLRFHKHQKQVNREFVISKASFKVASILSLCSLSETLMK